MRRARPPRSLAPPCRQRRARRPRTARDQRRSRPKRASSSRASRRSPRATRVVDTPITTTFDVTLAPRNAARTRELHREPLEYRVERLPPLPHDRRSSRSDYGASASSVDAVRDYFAGFGLHVGDAEQGPTRAARDAARRRRSRTRSPRPSRRVRRCQRRPRRATRDQGHRAGSGRAPHRRRRRTLHGRAAVDQLGGLARERAHRAPVDLSRRRRRDRHDAELQRRLHALSIRAALRLRRGVGGQQQRRRTDDRRLRTQRVRPGRPRDVPELLRPQPDDHAGLDRRRTDRWLRRRADARHRRGRGDGARARRSRSTRARTTAPDRSTPTSRSPTTTPPTSSRRRGARARATPAATPSAEQPIFEQMAAQGQTIVSAAGDAGSSDCNGITNNDLAVDDPASQPYVTGVGGLTRERHRAAQ